MSTKASNTFDHTLREMRQGMVVTELSEELAKLVGAVRTTGRGGELVLRLKVKPASRGDVTTLMITDDISVKAPRPEKAAAVFFSTENNELLRNDPRQLAMELKVVPAAEEKKPLVKVA